MKSQHKEYKHWRLNLLPDWDDYTVAENRERAIWILLSALPMELREKYKSVELYQKIKRYRMYSAKVKNL